MNKEELWYYLVPMMEQDADYQQALQKLKEIEPEYLDLLETLSPQQRDVLDRYISACEAVDDPLVYLAYQIGRNLL